jgi:hypothetical protein
MKRISEFLYFLEKSFIYIIENVFKIKSIFLYRLNIK